MVDTTTTTIIEEGFLKRSNNDKDLIRVEAKKKRKYVHDTSLNEQPRWHNQTFMLYLALRHQPEETMARTDLIKSALAIDDKICRERSVSKVFRGKTPMNSASAILTNNSFRYFVPLKPEGSKSMHFKLSFKPDNFQSALKDYNEWEERLGRNDWPICFSEKKTNLTDLDIVNTSFRTEFDEFMEKRKKARLGTAEKIVIINESPMDKEKTPRSWHEIVSLRITSSMRQPGVFAIRTLPSNIPLGFYFGVPLPEDEFDAMKDGVGEATKYAYLYNENTVIDPTDINGQLHTLPSGPVCPFHFVTETDILEKANVIFYQGKTLNQIVCWTRKVVNVGDQLYVYQPATVTTAPIIPTTTPSILRPVPIIPTINTTASAPPSQVTTAPLNTTNGNWQKKPSISSMLNTTIPT